MKYSEKDIIKILSTVDLYLSDINMSKVKRRAISEEIKSILEIENLKFETRRKVKMRKISKAIAIARANRQHPAMLQAKYEATGTEYVCGNGMVVDVIEQSAPVNKCINITAEEIKKELKAEGNLTWSKIEFVDWFLNKFPVCSSYTIKEILSIAKTAGVRVI